MNLFDFRNNITVLVMIQHVLSWEIVRLQVCYAGDG